MWALYGLIVGVIAKIVFGFIYPTSKLNDIGGLYTILLGAAGSYVGGALELILHGGQFGTAGLIMGVVGATVTLVGLHYAQTKGWLDQWIKD